MSSSGISGSRRAQRGFVLATTLLVTTLLTVMLAASLLLVSAEQRTTDNSLGTARALAIAQAGLQTYFADIRVYNSTYDSVRIALSGGYADVVARQVRPASAVAGGGLALWVVRSSGVATSPAMAGQTQGSRTVAQFAQLNPGVLSNLAAMVAANGAFSAGPGPNPISGLDNHECPLRNDSLMLAVGPGSDWNGSTTGVVFLGTGLAVVDWSHIDWPSLTSGNFLPDNTIPPATLPPAGSPSYQISYVPGISNTFDIPTGRRRGLLVVEGDVTMEPGAHWDGIIIAGGSLTLPNLPGADYRIHGTVITGLNLSLGVNVPQKNQLLNSGGGHTVQIDWASCHVAATLTAMAALVPVKNAWTDTWSTY